MLIFDIVTDVAKTSEVKKLNAFFQQSLAFVMGYIPLYSSAFSSSIDHYCLWFLLLYIDKVRFLCQKMLGFVEFLFSHEYYY